MKEEKYTLKATPRRDSKVKKLKRTITNGGYEVDSKELAEKLAAILNIQLDQDTNRKPEP